MQDRVAFIAVQKECLVSFLSHDYHQMSPSNPYFLALVVDELSRCAFNNFYHVFSICLC